jgi:predicted transcriptional regulator
VEKMSISLDPELGQAVREAATKEDTSVSAWLAEAARAQLRQEGLAAFLDDWQAEHGAFTDEEIRDAERKLGYRTDDTAA